MRVSHAADVWTALVNAWPMGTDAVLIGGAFICPVGEDAFDVVSAGEDALDSLDMALNEALGDALARTANTAADAVASGNHATVIEALRFDTTDELFAQLAAASDD